MSQPLVEKVKGLGELLAEAELLQKREIKEWRDAVDTWRNYFTNLLAQAPRHQGWPDSTELTRFQTEMREVSLSMTQAMQVWNRTREQFEANKAYVDLQNKLIEGWPKSWVADRTFYLGAGLLSGGGIAYALLGVGALLEYAVLWGFGAVLIVLSIVASAFYDRARSKYFAEVRGRVK